MTEPDDTNCDGMMCVVHCANKLKCPETKIGRRAARALCVYNLKCSNSMYYMIYVIQNT